MKRSKFIVLCVFMLHSLWGMAQKHLFSSGYSYSAFVCYNKTVQTWGDNYYGQLGRTIAEGDFLLPNPVPDITNIVSIDAGMGHFCCALTSDGYVLSWGYNFDGELGTDTDCFSLCTQTTPDTVHGGETGTRLLKNVKAIATGQTHAYALLNTGEVVAWGSNSYGQLGNGNEEDEHSPVYVKRNESERLSGIIEIAAGGNHGYALAENGTVYSWGCNQNNQLGCGDSNARLFPTLVIDKNGKPIENITHIDGGMFFGLMLTKDKRIYGVGAYKGTDLDRNGIHYKTTNYADFVLGGETQNSYLENVTAISAGYSHSLAIVQEKNAKHVVAWGDNRHNDLSQSSGGQLGIGAENAKQYFTPVYMRTNASTKVTDPQKIHAGCGVSFVETSQTLLVCGSNSDGQLGFGDKTDRLFATPQPNTCEPYCGNFQLAPQKTLCSPISYHIEVPFSETSFSFTWNKDKERLDEDRHSLHITGQGTYSVTINDKTGDCPTRETAIRIDEKEADFQMINTSFSSDEITFKVIGDGKFCWYNNGYKLGEGNIFTTTKSHIVEIVKDSVYQIMVEHKNSCQPLPMRSVKRQQCKTTAPATTDYRSCYNRETEVTALGDSIVWYADSLLKIPLQLGNVYRTLASEPKTFTLYATQITDRCESDATPTQIELYHCEPWYRIEGTVATPFGEPAGNATVSLFCENSLTPTDFCTTDENGRFSLYSHKAIGRIKATTNDTNYQDTWAGDTPLPEKAAEFIIDADIKHLTITLVPAFADIDETFLPEEIVQIDMYSPDGKHIATVKDCRSLEQFANTHCLFIATFANGKRQVIRKP